MEAVVLRTRGCLARRDFASARRLLEDVLARRPQALAPRELLTQVLLQENRDWPAAELALRALLALAPDHTGARHNLEALLRQQGMVAVRDG